MSLELPKRLERKTIYESEWVNLYTDRVIMPSGKIIEKYHQLDFPKQVTTVLLLNSKGEICFIKSLRYTTQKVGWELPAGGIEKGEAILDAAKREVSEETGYIAKSLKHRYAFQPSCGMSNQTAHIVFGLLDDSEQASFDTDEVQEVHWLLPSKVRSLIQNQEITEGVSLTAILLHFNDLSLAKD